MSWECYGEKNVNNISKINRAIGALLVDGKNGYGTSATPLAEYGKRHAFDSIEGKIIVVLTDGEWSTQSSEIASAGNLKRKGAIIYAIGIGDADYAFLSQIASDGGAKKIDLSQLSDTFSQIASNIATQL